MPITADIDSDRTTDEKEEKKIRKSVIQILNNVEDSGDSFLLNFLLHKEVGTWWTSQREWVKTLIKRKGTAFMPE